MQGVDKMAPHQKMAAMKLQDKELLKLVEQMNQAPDREKIKLMAEVLTRLVQQRSEMHEHGAHSMMKHGLEDPKGMHPHHTKDLNMEMDEEFVEME